MPKITRSEYHRITHTHTYDKSELLNILGFDPEDASIWVHWKDGNHGPGTEFSGPELVITISEDIVT